MSAPVSSSAPAAPSCAASLYDIPVRDASCAMPFGGNHTDIMTGCCGSADIVSYYDDCGIYCLAVDQTVEELTDCLFAGGAAYNQVFCFGNETETATATDAPIPSTAGASVVATGDANPTGSDSGSDATSSPESSPSGGAGARTAPEFSFSTWGLTVGALLFSATAIGAFQL